MLVVISDLHLEEEASRNIRGDGNAEPIIAPRNVNPKAFTKIFGRLDDQARRDGAKKIELVLAGDVFDLHRTALWFQNNPHNTRPYVSSTAVDAPLEAKLLEIIDATNQRGVADILAAFRHLAERGTYVDESGRERQFPVPVQLYYIPGNHDRLANATPAIRRAVRQILGIKGDGEPFAHRLLFEEEQALVRHGHEYDQFNFGHNYRDEAQMPLDVPQDVYDAPPFGDFVTIDVASRISEVFREVHGDETILTDPLLRTVYERILEFDDLRPMRAIFNFLLHIPGAAYSPEQIWRKAIEPVTARLLDHIHDDPFLHKELDKMDEPLKPDLIDAAQLILSLRAWNWGGLSLSKLQRLSDLSLKTYHREAEELGPHLLAANEETIRNDEHLFIVAGHTHKPAVQMIGSRRDGSEQYYVDTGTWRRQIPATPDFKHFGRIKALTYAVLYGPKEDPRDPTIPGKQASLDYWSGMTERWVQE